jgi:NodT family efflux transporter outer membrane factor (OMF) lipoprotein
MQAVEQYQTRQTLAGNSNIWPQDAWWRSYGDAQLDALIDEGLKGSPTMTIAEARLRRAIATTQVARSASQPQVSAHANPTMQKQSYNYLFPREAVPQGWKDYGLATLDFSWEIDFWGKNKAAIAAAISVQEASAADVAQAQLTLATSIAQAYGELARLFAAHDTATAAVTVRSKSLELLKKRHVHGMETLGSVKQAEAGKAAAEEELLVLDEQISLQRNRIAALLGAGPDRGLTIARPTIQIAKNFSLPQQLELQLLGRRPDIVAARLRAEASEKGVDKQKAEFYPNVNLAAVIGLQSLGLSRLVKSGSEFGSVGPAISLPIFNGDRLRGQLRGSQAERDEAIGNYNRAVTQALQEVADAAVSQKSLSLQLAKLEQAAAAAADAYRIINNRYQGGLSNYLEVLSAEEALLASLRALRDMHSRSFTLDVALIKALGGGYSPPNRN